MSKNANPGGFRLFVKQASYEWEFRIEKNSFTLGRTALSTVEIPLPLLSAIHLEFTFVKDSTWSIVDRKSSNGTSLGSVPMLPGKAYQVKFPATFKIGKKTELYIEIESLNKQEKIESVQNAQLKSKELPVADLEDKHVREVARDLALFEAKLAQARNAGELYSDQTKVAQKAYEEIEKKRKEEEQRFSELKQNFDQKQKALVEVNQRLEELRDVDLRFINAQNKLSELVEQKKDIEKQRENLRLESEFYKTEKDSRFQELSEVKKELEGIVRESIEKKAALDELKETLLRESEVHFKLQQAQQSLEVKEARVLELESRIELLQKEIVEKRLYLDQVHVQIESLRKLFADEEREHDQLLTTLASLKEVVSIAEKQQKLAEAALASVSLELVSSEARLKELNRGIREFDEKLAVLNVELSEREKKKEDLESSVQRLHVMQQGVLGEYHSRNEELRKRMETFEKESKERVELELAALKTTYFEWEKSEKEKIHNEYVRVHTNLRNILVHSPDQTLRVKEEREGRSAQAVAFFFAVLLACVFPQINSYFLSPDARGIAGEPQSSNILQERLRLARSKRPKFLTAQDETYRDTYTDNLIYLADYNEIKNDDDFKKAWALSLNTVFLKKLELDEKTIATFMDIEAKLLKELGERRSKIQLQSQERDIATMRSLENTSTQGIVETLKGEENYKKLRQYEADFYKEYRNKIKNHFMF